MEESRAHTCLNNYFPQVPTTSLSSRQHICGAPRLLLSDLLRYSDRLPSPSVRVDGILAQAAIRLRSCTVHYTGAGNYSEC